MPVREPTIAEYQRLLDENYALRVKIDELKAEQLAELKRIREENMIYIRELWDDNQKVHAELRYFNQREPV
jgi:hypothetical protein